MKDRLRELDFLRGVAIILVLLRHQHLFNFTSRMGWMGVDLFFVLSGFLVSGLLFKEYQRFGEIKAGRFLIRRGFKIYPLYYLFILPYLIWIMCTEKLQTGPLLGDLFFVQNYVNGWGYAFPASWSLAVEEHFYFGLTFCLLLIIARSKRNAQPAFQKFERGILVILFLCLALRIAGNLIGQQWMGNPQNLIPEREIISRNFTMTHGRIDSLLAGVLIAYWYYFKREWLKEKFQLFRRYLWPTVALLLAFTPFTDILHSFPGMTFGFTAVYIAFGLVLIYFLMNENINAGLNRLFSKYAANAISKIGVYSYGIYIIHTLVVRLNEQWHFGNHYLNFAAVFTVSVLLGMLMTELVEKYFLRLRDRLYPGRTA